MGVKDLWPIVDPVCEPVPLSCVAGKCVAVDLSGWVVESESSTWAHTQVRPYLRTLVYRLAALLRQQTLPVCVLDGAAPALKLDEMARRQGREAGDQLGSGSRTRLRSRLRRCVPLLEALGVPHVGLQRGEAEAVCAALDAAGRVDGVLTDDGDALLYGARTVYRQLSLNAGGQMVRCSAQLVSQQLRLGTNQLRALSVLLGCDFLPDGLPGIGPQTALELVRRLLPVGKQLGLDGSGRLTGGDTDSLMAELRRWVRDPDMLAMRSVAALGRLTHCSVCAHPGTARQHQRAGCDLCAESSSCRDRRCRPVDGSEEECACQWHRDRRRATAYAAEIRCRDRLLQLPDREGWFSRASQALQEFSNSSSTTLRSPSSSLSQCGRSCAGDEFVWRQPDVDLFLQLTASELDWTAEQAVGVVMPLLARWQVARGVDRVKMSPLRLVRVVRTSRQCHIDCYLVEWRWRDDQLVTTHEPRDLLLKAYPVEVNAFKESKNKSKKASRTRGRKKAVEAPCVTERPISDYFSQRKSAVAAKTTGATPAGLTKRLSATSLKEHVDHTGKENIHPTLISSSRSTEKMSVNPTLISSSRSTEKMGVNPTLISSSRSTEKMSVNPTLISSTGSTEKIRSNDCDHEDKNDGRPMIQACLDSISNCSDITQSEDEGDLSDIIDGIIGCRIRDSIIVISSDDEDEVEDVGEVVEERTYASGDVSRPRFSMGISAWLDDLPESECSLANEVSQAHSVCGLLNSYTASET